MAGQNKGSVGCGTRGTAFKEWKVEMEGDEVNSRWGGKYGRTLKDDRGKRRCREELLTVGGKGFGRPQDRIPR